jgi:uncharacterized DUF497 family protein
MIHFEWDDENAEDHWRKHRIRFEDARLVFLDPYRISETDGRFEYGEERWQTLGIAKGRYLLLVVAHTVHEEGNQETIRIISARDANAIERKRYDNRKF